MLQERMWLLVGPEGAGSRWHVDPHATSAFNLLVEGRKLWCLAPPSPAAGSGEPPEAEAEVEVMMEAGGPSLPPGVMASGCLVHAPPSLAWFRRHLAKAGAEGGSSRLTWCEQVPGEVMCVPRGWWHTTLNLEASVAYTQNVVLPHGARAAISALEAAGDPAQDSVAQTLREVLRERHS